MQVDTRTWILVGIATVIALTFHEVAHGYVAYRCGDNTAFLRGRLTLNPLKHIDPIGTIILPLVLILAHSPFLFGYAKPVPVDFNALRHPRRDMMLVAAAGPFTNFALCLLFLLAFVVFGPEENSWLSDGLQICILTNLVLGLFNLIPIPPLDGSKVLAGILPAHIARPYLRLGQFGLISIVIAVLLARPLLNRMLDAILNLF